jgi:hypothetical protein
MTSGLPECAVCRAHPSALSTMHGWDFHMCWRCLEHVWTCKQCTAGNKKNRLTKLVELSSGVHAFYRQGRLI